jgi:transcriptional regulator with XRE-family HTH domain
MGRQVNQRELAEIVGVTDVTLWNWQKSGLPILVETENGLANRYDTEAVISWMIGRELQKVGAESTKTRLERLQGDRLQLELDEKAGKLIPASEIEPAWAAMVMSARSFLRAESDRLAFLLDSMEGVEAKRDLLTETFDEFLRKLSTYDPGEGDSPTGHDAPGREEVRPAAEDDGRPVGGELSVSVGRDERSAGPLQPGGHALP